MANDVDSVGLHCRATVAPRRSWDRSCCSIFMSEGMRTSESAKVVLYGAPGCKAAYAAGSEPVSAAIAEGFVMIVPNVVPAGAAKPARAGTSLPAQVEPRYA